MAASKTVIANMALRHIKVGKEIANLDTERGTEAEACRVFYETVQADTLRDYPWAFANKFVDLSLIEEDPTTEWKYSYRLPSDCVRFLRILSGSRNDTRQSRIAFVLGADDSGSLIYTDQYQATAQYTFLNTTESFYPPDFVMALSLNLAFNIAPSLTGGDPFKLGDRAYRLYQMILSKASTNAANETQPDELPDSEFISTRNS